MNNETSQPDGVSEENEVETGLSRQALVVELDFAVLPGIRLYYEVCAGILKDRDIRVNEFAFARFCVKTSLQRSMVALKAGAGQEAEEIAEQIHAGVAERLLDDDCQPRAGMIDLIQTVRNASVRVVLASYLPEDSLGDRLDSLGLRGADVSVQRERPDRTVGYGVESWKRMASHENLSLSRCLALVGGGFSAKSALTAGMKVLACPDDLVKFEDFSGVDGVFECGDEGVDRLAQELLMV